VISRPTNLEGRQAAAGSSIDDSDDEICGDGEEQPGVGVGLTSEPVPAEAGSFCHIGPFTLGTASDPERGFELRRER
jgi:hypothetical protein